jgi:hypothetical protein
MTAIACSLLIFGLENLVSGNAVAFGILDAYQKSKDLWSGKSAK